jgi:Polyketide cyclase / dehydrase and lipid transport
MLSYERASTGRPADAWALLARPDAWHRWAPNVRGARGLGEGEVEPGRRGFVRLLGMLPIPVRVTAKRAGRSWTWRVGLVTFEHTVRPSADGCVVGTSIDAPAPVERALAVTYGPLVALLLRNLTRVAEGSGGS